jgi:murein DD-endopeptidase MepM/ murein hydrolase activator NlpD
VDFYKNLGLLGHNGIDLSAPIGTPVYATHDGTIIQADEKMGYGISVMIRTNDSLFDTIYGHLEKVAVKKNDKVRGGDLIGYADNTGKYTTGSHLHFGLRPVNYKVNNGYNGWIDPEPYMEKGWQNLPVDNYYGRERNWLAEYTTRFKNSWLQRQLINKYHRVPPLLSGRETNAIVYGGWGADEALNPVLTPIWYFLKKSEFQEGKKPPIRL